MFFKNLFQNGLRYVGDGRGSYISLEICSKTHGSSHLVVIKYEDDGPGFPKEYLHNRFAWKAQKRTEGRGFGIGLAAMHGIIEFLHNGQLDFGNREGDRGCWMKANLAAHI